MNKLLMYKCPGTYKGPKGIMHTYEGVETQAKYDELFELGYREDIFEAAKECGEKAYFKKRTKKKKGVNKYARGLPSTKPDAIVKVEAKKHVEEFRETFKEVEPEVIEEIKGEPEDEPNLLDLFKANPSSLRKEEHIVLGNEYGLKLRMGWKEETMIKKIQEAIEAK